jgi:membrane protein DedA with SNARE-associated domain
MLAMSYFSASITEGLVNAMAHLVRDGGLPAIFVLMAVSAACIPIPSEVVMLFAGFAIADPTQSGAGAHHHLQILPVLAVGIAGSLVGSWVAYGVGRAGRLELLERHGHLIHMGPAQIQRADAWFRRYGPIAVLIGRVVPVVRAFVSLPAGISRMSIVSFSALTLLGSAVWVAALTYAGEALGSEWQSVRHGFEYVDYAIVAAVIVAAAYVVVRRRRGSQAASEPVVDAAD